MTKYIWVTFAAIATTALFTVNFACSGADGDPAPVVDEAGIDSGGAVPCVTTPADGATE